MNTYLPKQIKSRQGFSLIELLVVIAIIGVLASVVVMMLIGPQRSARDGKRKSDLETIRSGLELYKADCGTYPAALPAVGANLTGTVNSPTAACSTSNVYIRARAGDPTAGRLYSYSPAAGNTRYTLCAALERVTTSIACGSAAASSCGANCSYSVAN